MPPTPPRESSNQPSVRQAPPPDALEASEERLGPPGMQSVAWREPRGLSGRQRMSTSSMAASPVGSVPTSLAPSTAAPRTSGGLSEA